MISKKSKLIMKIIITILMVISVLIGAFFLYYAVSDAKMPYFLEHFGMFFALLAIGIVALLLPAITNSRFLGNGKDSIMILVGFALIICGIIAIIYSYMFNF